MRVAKLVSHGVFEIDQGSLGEPAAGEIQVRVHACGICGSDLHNFTDGRIGDMESVYPMVLGHEPAGTVVKTGAGVTGWSSGDKALLEPAVYCYHCEYCLAGRHNLCNELRFLSQPGDPGYFRDRVNVPAECLLPMPDGWSFPFATLFEPLAVVVHSMDIAAISLGDTAAVFGAGPVGLMTVACLKIAGARRIIAIEPVPERRELALQVGADEAFDPASPELRSLVRNASGKNGVDVSIDCATHGNSLEEAIEVARKGGRVVVTGIPSVTRIPINLHALRRKEIHIYNVRRSSHDTEEAVELMKIYPELFAPIATHTRPLEQIQEAFAMTSSYSGGVGKMVIELH